MGNGFPKPQAGHLLFVDHLPSPARAERNQRRKLAFIPVWPIIASVALIVVLVVILR